MKRHETVTPLLVIALGVLMLFAPALIRADGLIYPARGLFSDLTITHWPAFSYLREWLARTGEVPLWRTSILGGTPFAADPVAGLWYPPNWLSLVVRLEWFLKWIVVAHLILGGWAMSRLTRSFGAGTIGATAAGLAYGIAPRIVAHAGAGHVTLVEAWAWLPVVAWAARGWSIRSVVASGLALGMCALADLRLAVYAGVVLCVYVLTANVDFGRSDTQYGIRISYSVLRVVRLLFVLVVAALVSAATWLPALSLAGETTRADLSPDEAGVFSLSVEQLLGVLLANRGTPENQTFLGLSVLLFALAGLRAAWRERRPMAVGLMLLIGLGLIAALGANTPFYEVLYRLPGAALLRVPGRAWFLVVFAVTLAGGMGVDALMRRAAGGLPKRWKLGGWVVGLFALLFGAGGAWFALQSGADGSDRVALSLIGLAICLPSAIAIVIARASGHLAPTRFGAIALLLVALDLVWVGWGQYRVVPMTEVFEDGRAVAEYVRDPCERSDSSQGCAHRIYSPSYSLPQHVAQAHGLQLADGIDPLQLARTVRFMQSATGVGAWGYSVTLPAFERIERDEDVRAALSGVTPDPTLLGLLNVRYVAAHFPVEHADLIERAQLGGVGVYENARAMPRAWVVGRVEVVSDQDEAMDWLASHDAREAAVVEGGLPLQLNVEMHDAQIVSYAPDRIVVSARGPGLLVVSEVYAREWRASIDGQAAPIYPADGVLRGVYLNDGEQRVEFVYDPAAVKTGVGVSGVMVVGWLVGWWVSWWAARRRGA